MRSIPHRFELEYILGSFRERTSKKCGHASLFAEVLHNLLSLRSRSPHPSAKRRVYPADCFSPIRYPAIRPGWRGPNAIRSIETPRVHHAARRRGGRVAACGAGAAGATGAPDLRTDGGGTKAIRRRNPISRHLFKSCSNWAGWTVATCGSTIVGPMATSIECRFSRKSWWR